jgi:hypothetical protein
MSTHWLSNKAEESMSRQQFERKCPQSPIGITTRKQIIAV